MNDGPLFARRNVGSVSLRDYQSKAVDMLLAAPGRSLLVVPTGGGKTVLASAIIAQLPQAARILFVAHRYELINQTVAQLERWGVTDVGVIRANDERTNPHARVQVASVQTLVRRARLSFDVCFIDEAHRATAASYRSSVFDAYPDARHIGLTATPVRLAGQPLGDVYQRLIVGATYSRLIEDGFIVEPDVFSTPAATPSLVGIPTVAGDYNEGQLEKVMLGTTLVGSVCEDFAAHRDGRRGVVFAVTVAHSKALVERLTSLGLRAAHIDGETPLGERSSTLAKLDAGELDVVSNVGVLTEGWDQPSVKVASIARPTKSVSLWMQMAGRILRPWNGVKPILLDHGDNCTRLGMPTEDRQWDLHAPTRGKSSGSSHKLCKQCFLYVRTWPCRACGYEPPKEDPKVYEDGHSLARMSGPEQRRAAYDAFVAQAKAKGYKPGYASFQFKERFGAWPPWGWSQKTKADCALDQEWQSRMVAKDAARDRFAKREEPEALAPEPSPAESGDSPFSDWLDEMGIR